MNQEKVERAQQYITTNVSGILEKLTIALLAEKPKDTIGFMLEWLDRNGDAEHRAAVRRQRHRPTGVETSESDSDEEQDEKQAAAFAKMLEVKRSTLKVPRKSVSAEAYGIHNPKGNFVPRVVPKDESTRALIRELLSNSFLFRHLDERDMNIVIDAMAARNFQPEQPVIRQGDDGNELFLVGFGQLRCTKRFPGQTQDTYLKTYEPGEYFGELALLYNVPRAASIKAITPALLYSLDRECFNHIVKEAAIKNRNIFEEFLSKVEVLQSLDNYERSKLCDCLKVQIFEEGQQIIREGEKGSSFYLIIEGTAVAMKVNPSTCLEEKVFDYKERMYFGELALLRDVPRAASIIATVC